MKPLTFLGAPVKGCTCPICTLARANGGKYPVKP